MNTINKNRDIKFRKCINLFFQFAQIRMMKSTVQSYESRFIYLRLSVLAGVKMCDLTGEFVTKWLNKLTTHPTANHKTRKNFFYELRLLNTILNWYKHFIDESFQIPITRKHWQMCVFKTNTPRIPDYFMKPKEAKKWVTWLKTNTRNPVYWQLAVFMLLTGARVGEAVGLTWEDIDLGEGIVRVIRRVRWDRRTKRPFLENVTKSSESARVLLLSNTVKAMLCEMKKKAVTPVKTPCFP